jgi:hypothetical protein
VPSKLYAILAAGRPYVAAMERGADAVRIAEQEKCGLVANPNDAVDLAARVRALYVDRHLTREMGQRARQVGLRFDRAAGVAAYDALARSLVNGSA